MAKIDFTAMKNSRKAAEDQIEDNIPAELEESYTSVWGSNKENIIYIETTRLIPFVDKYGNMQPFKLNEKKVSQIAASARDIGIVTPLTVRAKGDLYEIIAGHHRLAAAQIGQLKVPCISASTQTRKCTRYLLRVTSRGTERCRANTAEFLPGIWRSGRVRT